ncbi:MAG: hypothetical protein ACI8PZ_004281 [Myxococcota bacterium]|jgi:hypothetical protein
MLPLLIAALLPLAHAGRRDRGLGDEAPPKVLEDVLTSAGWTMTPERSSSYQAGDIYDTTTWSKVASRERCFAAAPQEDIYQSLQVVQAMQASANVRLGVVRVSGGGMQ